MTSSIHSISPLRQRMLDDMRMRKLEPKTQSGYIRAVRRLAAFLKRSPDTATVEDLRNFQFAFQLILLKDSIGFCQIKAGFSLQHFEFSGFQAGL